MSGSTSKVQRREFRKIVGDQAAELLEAQRDVVTNLKRENEALAHEFMAHRSTVKTELEKLHGRVDGASKWGANNEAAIDKLHAQLAATNDTVRDVLQRAWALEQRLDRFAHATFRERVRWALLGRIPGTTLAGTTAGTMVAPMPWGDGV